MQNVLICCNIKTLTDELTDQPPQSPEDLILWLIRVYIDKTSKYSVFDASFFSVVRRTIEVIQISTHVIKLCLHVMLCAMNMHIYTFRLQSCLSTLYWSEDLLQSQWNPAEISTSTITTSVHMDESHHSSKCQRKQFKVTHIVIFNHLLNEIHPISQRKTNAIFCPLWTHTHTHRYATVNMCCILTQGNARTQLKKQTHVSFSSVECCGRI